MSAYTFRSSKPDHWTSPRPFRDPTLRLMHHGRVQPMEQHRSGLLARLLALG